MPIFTSRTRAALVVTCLVAAALVSACSDRHRIPRIEPILHKWPDPYKGVDGLVLHVFSTGTMTYPAGLILRGGSWFEGRELDVTAFVVEHPSAGLIVFDTGFSPLVREDPGDYIGALPSLVAEFTMPEGGELPVQMRKAGLDPDAVKHVVLSHLHFDHTGSVEAFANATVVVSRLEREGARSAGWSTDFFYEQDYDEVDSWTELDYDRGEPYATFVAHHDLLGDGSVVLVDLRGHTAGSQGAIVRTANAPVLLTGDASSVEEHWRYAGKPVVAHDSELWWEQIWRIKKFVQLVPAAIVMPAHDLAIMQRIEDPALVFHELASTESVNGP